jgi:hypothetical protein
MSCDYCGMEMKKGERFVCAGEYPSWWKIISASNVWPTRAIRVTSRRKEARKTVGITINPRI